MVNGIWLSEMVVGRWTINSGLDEAFRVVRYVVTGQETQLRDK